MADKRIPPFDGPAVQALLREHGIRTTELASAAGLNYYTVTASPGGATVIGLGTTITINGLTGGTISAARKRTSPTGWKRRTGWVVRG